MGKITWILVIDSQIILQRGNNAPIAYATFKRNGEYGIIPGGSLMIKLVRLFHILIHSLSLKLCVINCLYSSKLFQEILF